MNKYTAMVIIFGMVAMAFNMPEDKQPLGIILSFPVGVISTLLYYKFIKDK